MMTYTSAMATGASGGGVLAAGSGLARLGAAAAFAFDLDQTQAAVRTEVAGEQV